MADVTLPPGWMALPGGQVYNPATNQILSQSQAAYAFAVPEPERFLPPQTPAAPATPAYSMDDQGNIGAAYDATYSSSLNEANRGFGMLNDQMAAQLTAQNPYGMAPVTVQGVAPNTTFSAPPTPPAAGTPEWINWIMSGAALSPVDQPANPSGVSAIRDQVGTTVQPFQTASPSNSGTTMLGTTPNYGTSETNFPQQTPWAPAPSPAPQYSTVQDTSAWRANPTALTPMQQAGRGMLYS